MLGEISALSRVAQRYNNVKTTTNLSHSMRRKKDATIKRVKSIFFHERNMRKRKTPSSNVNSPIAFFYFKKRIQQL